jgi:integrase
MGEPETFSSVIAPRILMLPYHAVARLAEINKPVSLHSLRHSFADRALRRMGLCSPFSSFASHG